MDKKKNQNSNTALWCQGGWQLFFGGEITLRINNKAMVEEKNSEGRFKGADCFFTFFLATL